MSPGDMHFLAVCVSGSETHFDRDECPFGRLVHYFVEMSRLSSSNREVEASPAVSMRHGRMKKRGTKEREFILTSPVPFILSLSVSLCVWGGCTLAHVNQCAISSLK